MSDRLLRAGDGGQKKWKQAAAKAQEHYEAQELLRQIHCLRGQLSPAKLCEDSGRPRKKILMKGNGGPASPCTCEQCEDFRVKLPSGEPLLSSLIELPAAGNSAFYLCSFNNESDKGRYFDWGGDDVEMEDDYLPDVDDISIGLFLVRKKDSKRLELTADASFDDGRFNDLGDFDENKMWGDSYLQWDLAMSDISSPLFEELSAICANVRFEAHLEWKDAKERATPPEGLDGAELDEWYSNDVHEPELLLSAIYISLLSHKTTYEETYDDPGMSHERRVRKARPGPDELLAMLRSPLFESRWA